MLILCIRHFSLVQTTRKRSHRGRPRCQTTETIKLITPSTISGICIPVVVTATATIAITERSHGAVYAGHRAARGQCHRAFMGATGYAAALRMDLRGPDQVRSRPGGATERGCLNDNSTATG